MIEETIDVWFQNLKATYEKKDGSFAGHKTGNLIKLFPFTTKYTEGQSDEDLTSFLGVIGECFRLKSKKQFSSEFKGDEQASFKIKLRDHIINNAISNVECNNQEEQLKDVLIEMFFEDDGSLVKYDKRILTYMNFVVDKPQLRDISKFIYDVFFNFSELKLTDDFKESDNNLFFKLLLSSMPELKDVKESKFKNNYSQIHIPIIELFWQDYKTLELSSEDYLDHIQDLVKYYYFFYLSQTAIQLNTFSDKKVLEPVYFSLDWEVLSESRPAYNRGWKRLEYNLTNLFAHSVTLELLNYLPCFEDSPKIYSDIIEYYNECDTEEKNSIIVQIDKISEYYRGQISSLKEDFWHGESWEKCENRLLESLKNKEYTNIQRAVYSLFYCVNYQFTSSGRNPRYNDYSKWFTQFCKLNYTKKRGRLGYTNSLNQETLLLLTKLCVGDNEKIRVKELWEQLEKRGVKFDESSKVEIIKLYERINLLEKKSDSGDAQYVKSII